MRTTPFSPNKMQPPRTRLDQVLGARSSVATGLTMVISETDLNEPHVVNTRDGPLNISTTPGMWSALTGIDMGRLRMKPVNMNDYNKNGYKNTVFTSDYSCYRFFVHPLNEAQDPSRSKDQVNYYVLARPINDDRRFVFT